MAPVVVAAVLTSQLGAPVPDRVRASQGPALNQALTSALAESTEAAEAAGWLCAMPRRNAGARQTPPASAPIAFSKPTGQAPASADAVNASAWSITGFGAGPGQNPRVQVSGRLRGPDSADTFAVPLRAGEVISATVRGAGGTVEVRDPTGVLVQGSGVDRSGTYPNGSPLLGGGNATVDHVAAVTGTHTITVRRAAASTLSTASSTAPASGAPASGAPVSGAPASGAPASTAPAPAETETQPQSSEPQSSEPQPQTASTQPRPAAVDPPSDRADPLAAPQAQPSPRAAPADGAYQAELGIFRSPSTPAQKIVLEFGGASIDTRSFGVETANNHVELSPMSTYLAGFGLRPADQPALMARISQSVRENLSQALDGAPVDVTAAEQPTASSFGQPGVSRVVIGGSSQEAGLNTVGIAESVDPGNFVREETALVLLDRLSGRDTGKPGDGAALARYLGSGVDQNTRIEFIGRALGNIASHEAGHLLGSWHTDAKSAKHDLMAPGDVVGAFGLGADRLRGTADDFRPRFGQDAFNSELGFTGIEDTHNRTAVGLRRGSADTTGGPSPASTHGTGGPSPAPTDTTGGPAPNPG